MDRLNSQGDMMLRSWTPLGGPYLRLGILQHGRPPLQERNILRKIKGNNSNPCRGCFFVINFWWGTIPIEGFKKSGSKIFFFKKCRKVPMSWTIRRSSISKHHISSTIFEPIHAVGVALCMGYSLLSFRIKNFFFRFFEFRAVKYPALAVAVP